ncbi:hypothetical protein DFA_01842 [Cavenderia fasciculata]|uniref:Saposin B-type domain-containing protein n=1 Tax=Cavenderia fasciculata TaxID=261658 RepID=F4PV48_CACFS|nr:uncharacterized protein DFA_01842 [Cavenderia fasciculata]EGG21956.1 hypothetical protein DFA_01842 [Cavenderia fasciculata]|eukprot:XP_004359807.1 hypothetical protein DFA_01842 [Cavenderia fasciculata]
MTIVSVKYLKSQSIIAQNCKLCKHIYIQLTTSIFSKYKKKENRAGMNRSSIVLTIVVMMTIFALFFTSTTQSRSITINDNNQKENIIDNIVFEQQADVGNFTDCLFCFDAVLETNRQYKKGSTFTEIYQSLIARCSKRHNYIPECIAYIKENEPTIWTMVDANEESICKQLGQCPL